MWYNYVNGGYSVEISAEEPTSIYPKKTSYGYLKSGNSEGHNYTVNEEYDESKFIMPRLKAVVSGNASDGFSGVQYTYDELGRIRQKDITYSSEGLYAAYEYTYKSYTDSEEGTVTSILPEKLQIPYGAGGPKAETYTYDDNCNITRVVYSSSETADVIKNYTYDNFGRLTSETGGYSMQYDAGGNIRTKSKDGVTATYTYDTANGNYDRLTSITQSGIAKYFTYDACGNPTRYKTSSSASAANMAWTRGNLLQSYDGTAFEYNVSGVRTKKNDTIYYLDGDRLLGEVDSANNRQIVYEYGIDGVRGLRISEVGGYGPETLYYFTKDLQGNVDYIYSHDGVMGSQIAAYYIYDAWGNSTAYDASGNVVQPGDDHIANINPFRYRGYYYDVETGFYYLISRYYDPETGRFISPDDIAYLDPGSVDGLNLYAYCGNDPVNYYDPDGHFVLSIFLACLITGAVLGGVTRGINAYNDGARGWDLVGQIAIGVGVGAVIGAGVGFVAGMGGAWLAGGLKAIGGKFIEDLFAYSMYGTPLGTWEDYSMAFIFGGTINRFFGSQPSLGGFGLDVVARPFFNQLARIGTGRQSGLDGQKYGYDVMTRGMTYLIPSPWRSFARGITRGHWSAYGWGLPSSQGGYLWYA